MRFGLGKFQEKNFHFLFSRLESHDYHFLQNHRGLDFFMILDSGKTQHRQTPRKKKGSYDVQLLLSSSINLASRLAIYSLKIASKTLPFYVSNANTSIQQHWQCWTDFNSPNLKSLRNFQRSFVFSRLDFASSQQPLHQTIDCTRSGSPTIEDV